MSSFSLLNSPIYYYKAASKESSSTMMYKVLSICATISLMMIMIQLMLFYIHEQQDAAHNYGTNSWMQYYPTVIYSVLPTIATTVFEPIATMLDKFEEWPTKVLLIFICVYC